MTYTNEFLARVFWAYAPEKIYWNGNIWNFRGFQDKDHVKLMPDSGVGYSQPFSQCKPVLTPLSDISDEDRFAILPPVTREEGLDYLRSKGYDMGYGGIPSLIDAGIAIKVSQ